MDIQEFKAWKITFFKNKSENGGAMAKAIEEAKQTDIILHSDTQKNGRMWGYTQPLKLSELIKKNNGIYEVITKFPHKVYFDVDGKEDCPDLAKLKEIINEYFPNAQMAISGSITDIKKSYHITLSNYIIHNEEERIIIKTIVKHLSTKINDCFDWKVYTKNRNMKCINQSKRDGRVQELIEDEDLRHHLITCFIDNYSLPLPILNEEIQETIMIEKAKTIYDISTLPKLLLVEPENFDIMTATPKQIISLLPLNKTFDHNYTHMIARFFYYNELSFETFLTWISKKHNPLSQDIILKWNNHWNKLNKFPKVSQKRIEAILSYYYPNILKDKSYKSFLNTFILPKELIEKVERLEPIHFENPNKFLLFNTGMGSGKTTQTINYLKNHNNFIWLCPNIALSKNTLHRLNESNVNVAHYSDFKADDKKKGKLNEIDNLIIVLNSLHYVDEKKFDIVVIDEIETLLDKFLGDFMGANKIKNWNNFISLLKNANKVILLDAFVTTKTLNLLREIENIAPVIYERIEEPITRTINYIKEEKSMENKMIESLKAGKKLFIYYPYKKQNNNFLSMEQLSNLLNLSTGKEGIFYNADIDDKVKGELKNVNKNWKKYDYVMTNNIVTCGVNYELKDFDESYIFIACFSCPRDIIQVSYRVRDLSSKIINVCYLGKMNQPNTFIIDKANMNDPIYTKLLNNILIEKHSPLKKTFQLFCNKANYKQVIDKTLISKELERYIDDLKTNAEVGFSYANLQNIDYGYAEWIQQKMFAQTATMEEKILLQKFFFQMEFKNVEIENQMIEESWDNQFVFFFAQLKKILSNKENLFNDIKEYNKFEAFFPLDIKKIKLNEDIIDKIFKQFDFKFITKGSHTSKIIKEIYNTYFGKHIIKVEYNKQSHVANYCLDKIGNFSFDEYYNFALNHLCYDKNEKIEDDKNDNLPEF